MAGTQERLEDEGDVRPQVQPRCSWCDEPGARRLEVEPAIKSTSRYGKPIERRHVILAPACRKHFDHFEGIKAQQAADRTEAKRRAREASK